MPIISSSESSVTFMLRRWLHTSLAHSQQKSSRFLALFSQGSVLLAIACDRCHRTRGKCAPTVYQQSNQLTAAHRRNANYMNYIIIQEQRNIMVMYQSHATPLITILARAVRPFFNSAPHPPPTGTAPTRSKSRVIVNHTFYSNPHKTHATTHLQTPNHTTQPSLRPNGDKKLSS